MRRSFRSLALVLVATQAVVGMAAEEKNATHFLVVPVPFSDPSLGTGLALGGVVFYTPNDGKHQWVSGAGGVWTSRDSRGIAAFHKMYLADDRFRLNATGSGFIRHDRFYGIGAAAGDLNQALRLRTREAKLKLRGLWEVSGDSEGAFFLGFQYLLLVNDAEPEEGDTSGVLPPPPEELDSTLSAIGPVALYDSRDNHDQPGKGLYLVAAWVVGSTALGDSFSHDTFTAVANVYHSLREDTVIAGRASLCGVGGDAAYYALCRYGSSENLRGYPSDRYRDRAAWTAQGEVRHQFGRRWGGVAFFGIGGISPSSRHIFSESNFLPAGGVGVRYRLFKDNDVRLRLDVAVGKDADGVYLSIGEAF